MLIGFSPQTVKLEFGNEHGRRGGYQPPAGRSLLRAAKSRPYNAPYRCVVPAKFQFPDLLTYAGQRKKNYA